MRQPLYVPLDSDERHLLLQLLDMASSDWSTYIDCGVDAGESQADIIAMQRELDAIEVMYERVDEEVPLTRSDVLRALRIIGALPLGGWQGPSIAAAPHLYAVLKARCTNVLRLARQESSA